MGRTFTCTICNLEFAAKGAHLSSFAHLRCLHQLRESAVAADRPSLHGHGGKGAQEQLDPYVEQGDDALNAGEMHVDSAARAGAPSREFVDGAEPDYAYYGVCTSLFLLVILRAESMSQPRC
jgi:hypothetical protein